MSQNLSELLELLIDDTYGELTSAVFSTLDRFGRLPLPLIIQKSGLSPKLVRHGLVVLIQQHLAFHHTSRGDTYYEAYRQNAYALVRSGKAISIIEERFGEGVADLALNLSLQGHVRVEDFEIAYGSAFKKRNKDTSATEAQANGGHGEHGTGGHGALNGDAHNRDSLVAAPGKLSSTEEFRSALERLQRTGFLAAVGDHTFMSPSDLDIEAKSELGRLRYSGGPKGPKAKMEFNSDLKTLKRKWQKAEDDAELMTLKPKATKKPKTNGFLTNGTNGHHPAESSRSLDEKLVIRLDQDKITMAIRTNRLVDLASRYIGPTTAEVYRGALQVFEGKQARCFDELDGTIYQDDRELPEYGVYATAAEIREMLASDLDLTSGLAPDSLVENGGANGNDFEDDDVASQYSEAAVARKRIRLIDKHLRVLSDDPRQFVSWYGNAGGGQWKIQFRRLCKYLLQQEIEDTTTARWGSLAARMIRVLHARGKLDEKAIAQFAMMKIGEARVMLRKMQESGFLDVQEIPRDLARVPSRTMYLWSYDQNHVRRMLLNDAYKCMSRLLQRRDVEKSAIQPVIDKLERADIANNREKFLSKYEQEKLGEWEGAESGLLCQLARLDDVVATLRDFLPSRHQF